MVFTSGCSKRTNDFDLKTEIPEEILKESKIDSNIDLSTVDIIDIPEKMFIGTINNIYINYENYAGKYIKIEGLYLEEFDESTTYSLIARYGPGCCVDDDKAGFQIIYDKEYPKINDWIEVIGILEYFEVDGRSALILRVIELNINNEERGLEIVAD